MDNDEFESRLAAHRAAFGIFAELLDRSGTIPIEAITEHLLTYERASRQMNQDDARIDELRRLRAMIAKPDDVG